MGEYARVDDVGVVGGRRAQPTLVMVDVSSLWVLAHLLANCVTSVGGPEAVGVTVVVPVLLALP